MEVQDLLVDDGPHVLRTALHTKPRGHSFKGQRKGSSCRGEAGTGGEDPRTGVQGRKHWPEGRVSRQHGRAGRELSLRSPVLQHPALGRWPHAARSLNVTKPDDMHQGRFGPHPPTAPRRGAPPPEASSNTHAGSPLDRGTGALPAGWNILAGPASLTEYEIARAKKATSK